MAEFNAAHALDEVKERTELIEHGGRLIPVLAAIIAVFAALATLLANHSSVTSLATKNAAILDMNKAADQYNYYESKRIKVQLNQALINAGAVASPAGLKVMQALMNREETQAKGILTDAKAFEKQSNDEYRQSEGFMQSYEKFEVAATLFEVSIVLVSITALMRNRTLLYVAGAASAIGLIYGLQGFALH